MRATANIERILPNALPGTRSVKVLRYCADPAKFKTLANLLNKFICHLELEGALVDADKIRITVSRGRLARGRNTIKKPDPSQKGARA